MSLYVGLGKNKKNKIGTKINALFEELHECNIYISHMDGMLKMYTEVNSNHKINNCTSTYWKSDPSQNLVVFLK